MKINQSRQMCVRLGVATLLGVSVLAACATTTGLDELPQAQKISQVENSIQVLVDRQVKKQRLVGMGMAVRLKDGTIIGKSSGYEDPQATTAYSLDTRTIIGSLTKTFTAVVTLQLTEEGVLSLDHTVDRWFPEVPNADRITIRMLLSHSSGLNNYFDNPRVNDHQDMLWTPMSLVEAADELGPVGDPGGQDGFYSNTNFVLLGMIIEAATGNPWDQEIESRIVQPLGLTNTVYAGRDGVLDQLAGGYTQSDGSYDNVLGTEHYSVGFSAGAMTSSLADLSSYAGALFGGELFEEPQTLDLMLTPIASQDLGMRIGFGLGMGHIEMKRIKIKLHPGNTAGYEAFIGFDPDTGASVVATANLSGADVMMPSIGALQQIAKYW